jgi:hypothetical protein
MYAKYLPAYPDKGSRRRLDEAWLELIRQGGMAEFLGSAPELPANLERAIEEFNQGEYWKCHETLEGIWLPERYPLRLFYHGLIKAAVGLLHLKRRNRHGAMVKLRDAEYTLAPFTPEFMSIDTGDLQQEVRTRLGYINTNETVDWDAVEQLPAVQIYLLDDSHSQPGG